MRPWKRRVDWRNVLARLPLPTLALAASYGVYSFAKLFVPDEVAMIQAASFELTYIGLAVTRSLDAHERKRATLISIGAVVASIVYNTLAGWFHRQPQLLSQGGEIAWLMFAILHGAPLAWVAYLVADLLLHTQPQTSKRPAQLRALARKLVTLLRESRTDRESWRQLAAHHGDDAARTHTDLETARAELREQHEAGAQLLLDVERARTDAARATDEAAQLLDTVARLRNEATQAQREMLAAQREFDQVAAQLRADLEIARAAASLDVPTIARRFLKAEVPLREIAPLLGLAESTLRGRLKAATNGHLTTALEG